METWIPTLSTLHTAGELEGKRDLLIRGSILYLKKGQDGRKSEVGREEHLRVKRLLRKTMELVG